MIFGSNGLLGNTFTRYFLSKENYETLGVVRNHYKISYFHEKFHSNFLIIKNIFDVNKLEKEIRNFKPNAIINCLGLTNKIKSRNADFFEKYIQINSLFPHQLYRICDNYGIRLIQLSTDCVFSGKKGFYNELDHPDPTDIYGKSKLLGELNYKNCLTIRKSVIGHEFFSKNGLLEWFLNKNEYVEGYRKAIFSGLTCLELAEILSLYILPQKDLYGILHISGQPVSKYDLLKEIAEEYNKNINIIPNDTIKIDRSMDASIFNKLSGYKPKLWSELIKSMHEFNLSNQ